MAVIGAILGDIAGSQYEFNRPRDLDWQHCELFTDDCRYTDDTVMTLAIKHAVDKKMDYQEEIRRIGAMYPDCDYGTSFYYWLFGGDPEPYNSYGNGSAMRVSYIGEHYTNLNNVNKEAERTAAITHNHPERYQRSGNDSSLHMDGTTRENKVRDIRLCLITVSGGKI